MTNKSVDFDVRVDRKLCVGSGNCVFHAAGAFDQDKDGFATVADLSAQPRKVIEFAVSSCPVGALTIVPRKQTAG